MTVKKPSKSSRIYGAILASVGLSSGWASEIKVEPSIETSYVYVADAKVGAFEVDSHNANLIKPKLQLTRQGAVWYGQWSVEHTDVQQSESGIDDSSYTNIKINNRFDWWKGRVVFDLNGSRLNQNIDDEFNAVTDPIFGQGEYIDVDTINSALTLQNSSASDWQNSLKLSFNEVNFDESKLEDTNTVSSRILNGETLGAALTLRRGQLGDNSWFSLEVDGRRVERENRGRQDSITGQFNLGLPLYRDFDFVINAAKAEHKVNSNVLEDTGFDSESYGAGIAWQLGTNSFIEVSQNKSTKGQEDDFMGVRLLLQTGRNSSLYFQQSRRFYGESNAFQFAQRGKRWEFSLSYDESLESQTRLQRNEVPNGFFLCTLGASSVDECEFFEAQPGSLADEQFTIAVTRIEFSLDEEITLRKSASANFNYQFRRSQLGMSYSRSENEFLELDELRETESISLNFSHQMSRRNRLLVTGAKSRHSTHNSSQNRTGYRLGIELERHLTRKATGSLSLKRQSDTTTNEQRNRKDNRIELLYRYEF